LSAASRFPTRITEVSNAVVLVGGVEPLVACARLAAAKASAARLIPAEVTTLATVCAESRPYAIVIAEDLYDFGGPEFDALARDVGAGLVVVPTKVQLGVLAALVAEEAIRLG
jgi:hypothetical protein